MTTGLEVKLFRALTDHLDAFATAQSLAIAYPGTAYEPTGAAYLRPWFMPATTNPFDLSDTNEYRGVFQVSVFAPEGGGVVSAMETASALAAHYQRGTTLEHEGLSFRIIAPPSIGPAIQEPGWLSLPVSVSYRAFLTP